MGTLERCVPEETYGDMKVVPQCPQFFFYDHYLNVCVPATLIQFSDQENEPGMTFIYGYILPILSFIVLTSHGVVIWVLYEQKTKRATIEPLLFMAICAVFMAISPLPFTVYYYNLGHLHDYNQSEFLCYLQKVSMDILPFFFNTLITFFTLLLGVQRFIAIQFPLDSRRWCTRKKIQIFSKIIVVVGLILSFAHYSFDVRTIYHFCITSAGGSFWVARCFVGYSGITRSLGTELLSQMFDFFRVLFTLIPSVLLLVITFLLIRAVRTNDKTFIVGTDSRHVSTINRHKTVTRASRNTTVMLTVIIILFLVGRLPSTILIIMVNFASWFGGAERFDFLHDLYLRATANIIMMTVHPISFAIYMLMSRRFRISLRKLLGFRWLASDEEMRSSTKMNSGAANNRKSRCSRTSLLETKFGSMLSFKTNSDRESVNHSHRQREFDCFLHPDSGRRLPPRSISNPIALQKPVDTSI